MSFDEEVRAAAYKWMVQNAAQFEGKPNPKAVMGRLLGERADWRPKAGEVGAVLGRLAGEIQAMGVDGQRAWLEANAPELLEKKKGETERVLPDLPGAEQGKVVMRLAPYPSGPLHVGNARMAVLNDEYVKRYEGKLLLVFDDTIGSDEKVSVEEAFDLIPEGLEWLGVRLERPFIYKSDRIPVFYDWARKVIDADMAYVCECGTTDLRANREQGVACAHRSQTIEDAHAGFEKMLDGSYAEGEAILRVKTDMQHPDPAFRDRVLMRISERRHPRVGDKYRVWPMLEFSWAVDDHLLGITHILRGKDLVIEDMMEAHIWKGLDLPAAHFGHFGMLRVAEAKMSKSKSLSEVRSGQFDGWADPRTWSLQALERRGIRPEAVREFVLSFGLSLSDVEVPAENLYAANRKLVDPDAHRLAFVPDPVELAIRDVPSPLQAHAPLHPDHPERGTRTAELVPRDGVVRAFVPRAEATDWAADTLVRLKDLVNFTTTDGSSGVYHSVDHTKAAGAAKIQWVAPPGVPCRVLRPDGSWVEGVVEDAVAREPADTVVQFERYGFVRLETVGPDAVTAVYAHR